MRRLLFLVFTVAAVPAQGQEVTRAAEIPALTEGPTVDRDGTVYFTELRAQKIYKLSPDGELTVFRENSHAANGLVLDGQERLIACEGAANGEPPRVTRTDLRTGMVEVLGAPDIERPNGLQIAPDDRTLYVIESGNAPTGPRMIRAFALSADGTAGSGRVLYDFAGRSADGMSVDTQGNLYVSAGLNALAPPGALAAARAWTADALRTRAGIYVISPAGRLLKFIPIAEDVITNNAFGGQDMRTLYVTAGRTLFQLRTDVPGLPR